MDEASKTQYNLYELLQQADSGDVEAMRTAANILFDEGYLEDDPDGEIAERLVSYRTQVAESDGRHGYSSLGEMYRTGIGMPKDPNEAIKWFQRAADSGFHWGNECLGWMYFEGDGIPVDYKKAFEYFTIDNFRKLFCTTYALGEMYRLGLYVAQDDKKACEYYASIVYEDVDSYEETDSHYWCACFRLGAAYHHGLGVEKDAAKAIELLSKAKRIFDSLGDRVYPELPEEELNPEWQFLVQHGKQERP